MIGDGELSIVVSSIEGISIGGIGGISVGGVLICSAGDAFTVAVSVK